MVLAVGQSYKTNGGKTAVTQGAVTPEQKAWWHETINQIIGHEKPIPLTPAQKLYIALCQNGFHLKRALELKSCGLDEAQKVAAQQALKIRDDDGDDDGIVTEITRPSFVGANLNRRDLREVDFRGAQMQGAQMQVADLGWASLCAADLRDAQMQGAELLGADLRWANLEGADLEGADLMWADLRGADISNANFNNAKNLQEASLDLAFYCQDNPPKNLEEALKEVEENKRPMALTKQEYDKVYRLRNSDNLSAFSQELGRLRGVCNKRIDSRGQVDAAKAKFEWCKPLVSTNVAIMFSQGFNPQTRAAWYGNSVGGTVLRGISYGLEFLNHLVGRGSRQG